MKKQFFCRILYQFVPCNVYNKSSGVTKETHIKMNIAESTTAK